MPKYDSKVVTLPFMRSLRYGSVFAWRNDEVNVLEPKEFLPLHHLRQLTLEGIHSLLSNKKSFAHKAMTSRDGNIPYASLLELFKHLDRREADRQFYIAWLSKLHVISEPQSIFQAGYKYVKLVPEKPKTTKLIDLSNEDDFFNVMLGKLKPKHFKDRKTLGISAVERIQARIALQEYEQSKDAEKLN